MNFKRDINPLEALDIGKTHGAIKIHEIELISEHHHYNGISYSFITLPEEEAIKRIVEIMMASSYPLDPMRASEIKFVTENSKERLSLYDLNNQKILYRGQVYKFPLLWKE